LGPRCACPVGGGASARGAGKARRSNQASNTAAALPRARAGGSPHPSEGAAPRGRRPDYETTNLLSSHAPSKSSSRAPVWGRTSHHKEVVIRGRSPASAERRRTVVAYSFRRHSNVGAGGSPSAVNRAVTARAGGGRQRPRSRPCQKLRFGRQRLEQQLQVVRAASIMEKGSHSRCTPLVGIPTCTCSAQQTSACAPLQPAHLSSEDHR